MIAEALEYLIKCGQASQAHVIDGVPGPKHTARIETRDGNIVMVNAEPDPRDHKARDLSAIIAFAEAEQTKNSAVWYSRDAVVCLINDDDRRDRVTLRLDLSPQILQLMAFEKNTISLKQSQLVILLRTTFAGCLSTAGEIITIVRNLKFKATIDGQSNLQHGSSSVGRALQQEITGAKAIPEEITLDVPIFANAFNFTGRIRVAIDIDIATETFRLIPLPLEIERAIAGAENKIGEALNGSLDVEALYGTP